MRTLVHSVKRQEIEGKSLVWKDIVGEGKKKSFTAEKKSVHLHPFNTKKNCNKRRMVEKFI